MPKKCPKAEKPNPKLTGKGGKKNQKEHERWYMDGHGSVMKKYNCW